MLLWRLLMTILSKGKTTWTVFHSDGTTVSNISSKIMWDIATHVLFENDLCKVTLKITKPSKDYSWMIQHVQHSRNKDIEVYILTEINKKYHAKTAIHVLPNGIVHHCHTVMCSLMQEYMKAVYEGKLLAIENLHGRLQTKTDAILK